MSKVIYKNKKDTTTMRTPDNIMYNSVDRHYQKTPTPSHHMSHESLRHDEREGIAFDNRERYNILEAQEAAEAAKPFMDIAVALHKVGEAIGGSELTLENKTLIEYAEQRARLAAKVGESRILSDAEQKILNVYEAQAEAAKIKLELGAILDNMGPEEVNAASIEAEERGKKATTREEKAKWLNLAQKLDRYKHFLESGQNIQDKEFSTDTTDAMFLLGRMNAETGETTELNGEPVDNNKLKIQANNLHSEAEMIRFAGSHMKLEETKRQIAGIKTRS